MVEPPGPRKGWVKGADYTGQRPEVNGSQSTLRDRARLYHYADAGTVASLASICAETSSIPAIPSTVINRPNAL